MTELRLALRRFRRRPTRGLVTAATLALGIGAAAAAFAAVDGVLLRDLPVEDQDALVLAWHVHPERGFMHIPFRMAAYETVVREAASLSAVAGVAAAGATPTLVDDADGYVLRATLVADDFFGVLGVHPAAGRLLDASDDRVGADPVLVLSHGAWTTRYGADPAVVGSTIPLAGRPYTVVGVAPEGFDTPRGTEVWRAVRAAYPDWEAEERTVELDVVGRLAPGATPATVTADLTATFRDANEAEAFYGELEPVVRSVEEHVRGPLRPVLRAGLAGALLLLLAAVASTALLLLAGGSVTAHDMAVRRALGAGRVPLVARIVSDAAVVGAMGALGGLALAWLALRALLPMVPVELAGLEAVSLDGRSVLFAVALALTAVLLAGATAGLALVRSDLRAFLAAGGRDRSGAGSRVRTSVAGLQVALTVVTAVGAGLLVRTVTTMDRLDPGFEVEHLRVVALNIPYGWFDVPGSYLDALDAVSRELEARPGIAAARPTLGPPLANRLEVVLTAEGQDEEAIETNPYVAVDAVLPGHLEALGIPLRAGRDLTEADDLADADPVVVVDEVLARALWPGQDPVGKRINGFGHFDTWFTVVGVAGATRYRDYLKLHPRAYYPLRRMGNSPSATLLVRTSPSGPASVRPLVADAFARVDPGVRVLGEEGVAEILRRPVARPRFAAGILLSFAVATLLLTALGVYGVFTAWVEERTREMGVRRALGAQKGTIVRHVLGGIVRVALVGAAVGLAVAVWAARWVESLLYGVGATDPVTFGAVVLLILGMAVLAGLVPALRAASTDPAVSLRSE